MNTPAQDIAELRELVASQAVDNARLRARLHRGARVLLEWAQSIEDLGGTSDTQMRDVVDQMRDVAQVWQWQS